MSSWHVALVLLEGGLEVTARGVQLGLLPAGAHPDRGQAVLLAAPDALVQALLAPATLPRRRRISARVSRKSAPASPSRDAASASGRRPGSIASSASASRSSPISARATVSSRPMCSGTPCAAAAACSCRLTVQRGLEVAPQGLGVGPVVEHHQLAVDVAEFLGHELDLGVPLPGRLVPVEGEAVAEPRQVVDPHGRVGVLVEQVHGPDGVLQGQRDVAELLEHRRQHEVTAGEGAAGVVVGGPAVHVLGDPAGLGDVAATAEQVGLDELRALLELGEAQLARGGDRLLGALLGAAAVEAGEHLQLDHGRQQLGGARVADGRRERGQCARRSPPEG